MKRQAQGSPREQPQLKRLQHGPGFARIVAAVEMEKGERWPTFRDRRGDWGRDVVLYLGRRRGGLRLRELAKPPVASTTQCADRVHRLGQRLAHDQKLRRVVNKLEAELFDDET